MDDRIILVDDDPDYLDILTTRLTAAGFRNLRAADDFRAKESLENHNIVSSSHLSGLTTGLKLDPIINIRQF
jgi:DNA-binding response OmpR family regulator